LSVEVQVIAGKDSSPWCRVGCKTIQSLTHSLLYSFGSYRCGCINCEQCARVCCGAARGTVAGVS